SLKYLCYICQICFKKNGGHIHIPPGQEKRHISYIENNYYNNDTEKSLELISK
ncbi:8428_t:CDS:1, partial [Funneliformis geosporum]